MFKPCFWLLNHGTCWMTQIHMNLTLLQSYTSSAILSHLYYHPSWLLGLGNLLPHLGTTGPLLAGWVSIKWTGLTPHLHHNTVALWESRGIGAVGVRTSTQKPSQLSLFCKVLLPLLSFHMFATPHLHHNTVALWESRGIGAAGVRTSTQKPSQLPLFCKVLLPLLSFHIFATIPLDFLVWATSCHILYDWALAAYYRSLCLVCWCSFSLEWSSGGPTLRRTAGNFDFTQYCIASSDLSSDRAE